VCVPHSSTKSNLSGSTLDATITRQAALSNSLLSVATRPPFSWWGRPSLWRGTSKSEAARWASPASTDTFTLRNASFFHSTLLEVGGTHVAQSRV
jgi:hypothetical protein